MSLMFKVHEAKKLASPSNGHGFSWPWVVALVSLEPLQVDVVRFFEILWASEDGRGWLGMVPCDW